MKQSNKLNQFDAIKSVRKTWGFSPITRVVKDKKKYSRKPKHKGSEL